MSRTYHLKKDRVSPAKVDYERDLNPQQLAAVTASPGPVLVIAGAGSGKTRVVTYRVAYLLEQGYRPEEILLLTFTKRAAEEMLRRVGSLVAADVSRIWGGTFHHVGNLVLRHHARRLELSNDYIILDREDSRHLLEVAVAEEKIDTTGHRFPRGGVLLEVLSFARNTGRGLEPTLLIKAPHYLELIPELERVYRRYESKKRGLNYLDFDDLLIFFKQLLDDHPPTRSLYQERFRVVLVDEYQDTNILQAEIVDTLAAARRNLTVVGDDSQSIYSFRGAEFRNIRDFPLRYPDCRVYTVETNYRSTPQILELTNAVIKGAQAGFQKTLRPVRPDGPLPALVATFDVYEQAQFVAQRILELRDEGTELNRIAVLYRSHYHSLELQLELTRRGIPFAVRSGLRFFEQAHIKDVCSYLKILTNPKDELAWKRVLQLLPRVGVKSAAKIWDSLYRSPDPLDFLGGKEIRRVVSSGAAPGWERFLKTIARLRARMPEGPSALIESLTAGDYQDYLKSAYPNFANRLEDLKQLAGYASRWRKVDDFLSELAMAGGLNAEDIFAGGEDEMVTLSTVHQAKGLEWDVVFVVWLAEGKFPPASGFSDPEAMEEERRLFYVSATRSRDELYLVFPRSGGRGGMPVLQRPTRFVGEIPPDCFEAWDLH